MSHPDPTPTAVRSRRALASGGALALALGLAVSLTGTATAQAPTPTGADRALFGEGDPSHDGVWRQSVALLAQDAVGYTPADEAVEWLLDQQCDDGSFHSYRADPDKPCRDVTAADTNATALAVQALTALGGHAAAVDDAVAWLRGVQNEDGGWSFNPGGATDANSTALVVGALTAAGEDPAQVRRDGVSPFDALTDLQLGCDAPDGQRGAFAWQPDPDSGELYPNDAATVDAVLALSGSGLLVDPEQVAGAPPAATPPDCDADDGEGGDGEGAADPAAAAAAGAAYLVDTLQAGDHHLVMPTGDGGEQPDHGTTARAVIALAAAGQPDAAQETLGWLQDHHGAWQGYAGNPAAVGTLVLAAHAVGAAPEDFAGTDLVQTLRELGPTPDDATPGDGEGGGAAGGDGGAGALPWLVLGAAVVLGATVALVVARRRRAAAGPGSEAAAESEADTADAADTRDTADGADTGESA